MAVMKRPAFTNLTAAQIEAAARGVALDHQHFARRVDAARADSAAVSREIDQAIRGRMAAMSVDQLLAVSAAQSRGESLSAAVAAVARADASTVKNGLRMIEHRDDSGRPIREFTLEKGATKMSSWMGNYAAIPQAMLALNIKGEPQDIFESKRAQRLANAQHLARIERGEIAPSFIDIPLA
ncbi:hypothetical protein EVC45_10180 [Paraburkholderia sp. UYCP14C]|uniref:hypothetical protein n=1 Tax=Paraburkholderia sp. UYCP14C TaxID=2511130 RepID=UPI00101EBDFF|nr:hypothetical protein [Paraburkholderia sp. UYCP14C]RZF29956.1 hypothetical protein EVC45_10180 [Paraburkholderia sp. UYCP14C]